MTEPVGQIDTRYSSPDAVAPAWITIDDLLTEAPIYWLSTVRPDSRPHVTPVVAVWLDHAIYFSTGPQEQKARNLAINPGCVLTTGANTLNEGLDLVVEGAAVPVTDHPTLRRIAAEFEDKYGSDWAFEVRDGAFSHGGHTAAVFAVAAIVVFAHSKGTFAMTRYSLA
jgi:Pyridoxamine 5'-phosphate oxidase